MMPDLFFRPHGVNMQFPNTRYGNPVEMQFYVQGLPIKDVSVQLRRSEKSVRSWLNGDRKIPWWVPELLRLRNMEREQILRQMGVKKIRKQLGIVQKTGVVIPFERDRIVAGRDDRPKRSYMRS
jgi:hypothetical protein